MRVSWRRTGPKLRPAAAPPVLFIGDSITFSWREVSEHPGLVNRGVPIETTDQIRARFETQVVPTGAAGVHILAGVNDIAGNVGDVALAETRANLRAMAAMGQARRLRVWLASVLPVIGIWWAPAVTDAPARIVELNRGLKADARALGVDYIDYHGALADPRAVLGRVVQQLAKGDAGQDRSPSRCSAVIPTP